MHLPSQQPLVSEPLTSAAPVNSKIAQAGHSPGILPGLSTPAAILQQPLAEVKPTEISWHLLCIAGR